MATQLHPEPNEQPHLGSPYCSDPDCISCKELRTMQEYVSNSNHTRRENRTADPDSNSRLPER